MSEIDDALRTITAAMEAETDAFLQRAQIYTARLASRQANENDPGVQNGTPDDPWSKAEATA